MTYLVNIPMISLASDDKFTSQTTLLCFNDIFLQTLRFPSDIIMLKKNIATHPSDFLGNSEINIYERFFHFDENIILIFLCPC